MSDEKTAEAVTAAVPLTALGTGAATGDVLTWNGTAWVSNPASPAIVRATFNPFDTSTVTINGTVGEITMDLFELGNVYALGTPRRITINNSSIAAGDLLFVSIRYNHLQGKEAPVWATVANITNGQAVIILLSTTEFPFAASARLYISFNIIKA